MHRRNGTAVCALGLFLIGFVVAMVAHPGGDQVTVWIDDLGLAGAGMIAAAALGVRAWHDRSARLSWSLLAVATSCAAFGDAMWANYELIQGVPAPFPSLADASYLLFPVFAAPALMLQPARTRSIPLALRMLVDGLLVSGSLFAIFWLTKIQAIVQAGATPPSP